MSEVYSPRLREIADDEARSLGFSLQAGVYACMPGPSYETPAEIRMLRTLGADVVGMSTVPEAIVARHAGMDVLAFAVVSNAAAGISKTPITHAEVLEAGQQVAGRLAELLTRVVGRIDESLIGEDTSFREGHWIERGLLGARGDPACGLYPFADSTQFLQVDSHNDRWP